MKVWRCRSETCSVVVEGGYFIEDQDVVAVDVSRAALDKDAVEENVGRDVTEGDGCTIVGNVVKRFLWRQRGRI